MKIKLILSTFVVILIYLFSTSIVSANEGRIVLSNGSVNCEGISVWQGYDYQLAGKCFGLVYPFDEQLDNYVLWVKTEDGEIRRVGGIDTGVFDDTVTKKFTTVYVTAENDSNPRQAGRVIASGDIQRFNVPNNSTTAIISTPIPTSLPAVFLSSPTPLSGLKDVSISRVLSIPTITGILVIALVIVALLVFIRRR